MTSIAMSTGVTETIWHFAGYMHLIDEVATRWTLYDDHPPSVAVEDLPWRDQALPRTADLDEIYGRPTPLWPGSIEASLPEPMLLLRSASKPGVYRPEAAPIDLAGRLPADDGGGGGSVSIVVRYSWGYRAPIEREDAFGETVAQIRQANVLHDSDVFVWGEDLASGLLPVDPAHALGTLLDAAGAAVPDALAAPIGQADIGATLVARYEAMKAGETDAELATYVAQPGRYVNGEAVPAEWELEPFDGAPVVPEGANGHEAYGAHAHLGGNEATNIAVVQDLNELSLQTIVFGDWYKLDAIVQINAIMDVDEVTTFGAQLAGVGAALLDGGTPSGWGGGNRLTNIAEFLEEDVDLGALELPGFGGLRWTVDVLDGDFWDVKAVYQTNWIIDDDVYSKTTYEHFSQVRMGENLSVNLVDFFQAAGDYDLIVIGGNYYGANWIVQANVLLDSDVVLVGHMGGGGQQTISTGQNELTNDALIARYGGGGFQALDEDLAAFVQRLLTEDDVDPAEWWALNGIGSGEMRVLYVTGDYYDANLVSQLNVVSDADALAQVLPADALLRDGGAEQWVATGGNTLSNIAIIVDTEAVVATHVGGEVYDESFLVQAEIVIDDDDAYDDPGLAPELVAFTGGEESVRTDDEGFSGAPLAGQGDQLGSMLT